MMIQRLENGDVAISINGACERFTAAEAMEIGKVLLAAAGAAGYRDEEPWRSVRLAEWLSKGGKPKVG